LEDSTIRDESIEVYVGGTLQSQNFVGDGSTVNFVLQDSISSTPVVLVNQVTQVLNVDYTVSFDLATGYTVQFTTAPSVNDIIDVCNYSIIGDSPCQVSFIVAPVEGLEVTILVRRGVTWYAPGAGTPSNGHCSTDKPILRPQGFYVVNNQR
jgi:hypothetical protein